MKTALIISFSDLSSDPRISRQLCFLKDRYKLIACGTKKPNYQSAMFYRCEVKKLKFMQKIKALFMLFTRQYEKFYWSYDHVHEIKNKLNGINADIIIANDLETLPLALKLSIKAKIVLDAHEYAPRQFEDRLLWRLFLKPYKHYLCKKYIRKADAVITVSGKIAEEYAKNYGIKPHVVNNAPYYLNIVPKKTDSNVIRMIHHGIANPSRNIETMIRVMEFLDERFSLDLMLVAQNYSAYYKKLCAIVKDDPRVNIIPPVDMNNVIKMISKYDLGIYILKPVSFNQAMALPNKIFEYIQARLAVAIGPSVEMKAIVEKYGCGVVAEDFSAQSMARVLQELDHIKIDKLKNKAHEAARALSAEANKEKFLSIIDSLCKD